MLAGARVRLRPLRDNDWTVFTAWGETRDQLWGSFQRYQLDHLTHLREAYERTRLLTRESAWLLIERNTDHAPVGFVRYGLMALPDGELPTPEIGFGIPDVRARGQGYATEAVRLIMEYLFAGFPTPRISAFTEAENIPAQRVLEHAGFDHEGTLRRAMFRDGAWRDMLLYAALRHE
jgi:RimJ/RimL family protein N-acetyltransferase